MLFDVFAFAWPLKGILMRDRPLVGWIAALVFYGAGLLGEMKLPNVFCVWTACKYFPFFYLGMRIRLGDERRERNPLAALPWPVLAALDVVVFAGTMYISHMNGALGRAAGMAMEFILHLIGAVMAYKGLQALAGKLEWRQNRGFMRLSAYSMSMYLFHQQIIYFTILWLNGEVNPYVNAGVNFACAFAGAYVISHVLMQWNTTRVLLGEKPRQ